MIAAAFDYWHSDQSAGPLLNVLRVELDREAKLMLFLPSY